MRAGAAARRETAILWQPSPNFGPRRQDARPDLIVLHYTGMPDGAAALDRLCDPGAEVSAHYLISEQGAVLQLVAEDMRAWHAGAGQWGGVSDVNSRSIGIELVNTGAHPFPEPQMTALEALLRAIARRWHIPPERVIAHSDLAPLRKSDPGRRFDWRRLARAGLSVWSDAAPGVAADWPGFLEAAARFGYPVAQVPAEAVLAAFRLRFRPGATGPLAPADLARLSDLAARYPVDRRPPSA